MLDNVFFDDWPVLLRTVIIGVLSYGSLIALLRISGKRTLSKLNAFDLIVTVALGSTLASLLTNTDVALAQGVLAFAMLIGLQFAITWTSVRAPWVRRVVTGEPALVFFRGELLAEALRRARTSDDEVYAAIRSSGIGRLEEVEAVVLETDGSFSVIRQGDQHGRSSLAGVGPSEGTGTRLG